MLVLTPILKNVVVALPVPLLSMSTELVRHVIDTFAGASHNLTKHKVQWWWRAAWQVIHMTVLCHRIIINTSVLQANAAGVSAFLTYLFVAPARDGVVKISAWGHCDGIRACFNVYHSVSLQYDGGHHDVV
jgi:hypothetical protein